MLLSWPMTLVSKYSYMLLSLMSLTIRLGKLSNSFTREWNLCNKICTYMRRDSCIRPGIWGVRHIEGLFGWGNVRRINKGTLGLWVWLYGLIGSVGHIHIYSSCIRSSGTQIFRDRLLCKWVEPLSLTVRRKVLQCYGCIRSKQVVDTSIPTNF